MISPDSSLTSLGDSAANSGLNPLNSTVEVERRLGVVEAESSRRP